MDTFTAMCTGALFGFLGLFVVVALAIKADDKTPLRKTTGEFLKELGTLIAKEKPKPSTQN